MENKQIIYKIRDKISGKIFIKSIYRNGKLALKAGDVNIRKKIAEKRKKSL